MRLGIKNAVIYGIMVGTQTALMFCQLVNLFHWNAQMIQPLRCDLLTGAFLHRLLDVIARHIGEETVYPDADIFLLLGP